MTQDQSSNDSATTSLPDSYFFKPEIASLLTKLAALQGHAVPAFRFGMTQKTADGVEISTLSISTQLLELWTAQFPSGVSLQIKPEEITKAHFPLVWVSPSSEVFLIRGQLSNQQFSVEDALTNVSEISGETLSSGQTLMLKPAQFQSNTSGDAPQTAGQWFVYSVRKFRSVFFDAVLATFVVSVVGLVGALYSMQVYDRVVPTKGYSTLIVLSVGALVAILLELILKQVRAHMIDKACKAIDLELSSIFFGKALDIRMDARPKTVGTFASQIRYFESVRSFLTSSTLFVLADTPFAIFFIIVIATISLPVALVPIVMLPIAFLIGALLRKPIEDLTALNMAESNKKNGLLIEAIDGIESIKAANSEWKVLDRWRALTAIISDGELRSKALITFSSNITQTLQQLSYVGMVAVGAYEITQGQLSMGGLIACTIISGRALGPFAQIPQLIVQWKQAQIALKSLDAIMAMPSDRDENQRLIVPEICTGNLKLEGVSFSYLPTMPVLQIDALQIQPGERVAVVGSIGSGKSTLIKLLSGLYRPTQGRISLDSQDVSHLAAEYVREHIGYLPQDVRLFQGTLRENLTLGLPSPGDSQILRAAAMTGLDRVIQSHPRGLELEISEGGRGLSGGQRQLVGLTRMLLQQPKILLLDEPTASMDSQIEMRVMQHMFNELPSQSSLIVVTHKTAVLAHVQRLIVMEQGRIVLDGPRDQVLERLKNPRAVAAGTPAPQIVGSPAQSKE